MLVVNHAVLVIVNIINKSTRFKNLLVKQTLLYLTMMSYIWVIISTGISTYP